MFRGGVGAYREKLVVLQGDVGKYGAGLVLLRGNIGDCGSELVLQDCSEPTWPSRSPHMKLLNRSNGVMTCRAAQTVLFLSTLTVED